MNNNNISDDKIEQMLKSAGISPDKVKDIDSNKLNKILSNPDAVQRIMSTPAAQALLKKFTNK